MNIAYGYIVNWHNEHSCVSVLDRPGRDLYCQFTVIQVEEGLAGCQGNIEGRKH